MGSLSFLDFLYSEVMKETRKRRDHSHEELRDSWYLLSSEHLGHLYQSANKEGKENIYDHMLNHGMIHEDYEGYMDLAEQIEKELWGEPTPNYGEFYVIKGGKY